MPQAAVNAWLTELFHTIADGRDSHGVIDEALSLCIHAVYQFVNVGVQAMLGQWVTDLVASVRSGLDQMATDTQLRTNYPALDMTSFAMS